jgi:two-component system sensor histidine kinase RegB
VTRVEAGGFRVEDDDAAPVQRLEQCGVWLAILLGVAFLGVYAWRVTQEARDLAQALTATEFVLAREQHLSQLDGLAAAAAHELGTPLATIALVAKELDRNGPKEGLLAEDIALLRQQVERCRGILGKLTSLGNEPAGPLGTMTLSLLIEEVASPHRPFDVEIGVTTSGKEPEPTCRRNPGLIYGLGNLIENAVDFALNSVNVTAWWDAASVRVEIIDDGPGFPAEILDHLGEPYVSTRARDGGHMGLGIFIALTLLERSGATLEFGNVADSGARVCVRWPRARFQQTGEEGS